jgi:hypothetical protein
MILRGSKPGLTNIHINVGANFVIHGKLEGSWNFPCKGSQLENRSGRRISYQYF